MQGVDAASRDALRWAVGSLPRAGFARLPTPLDEAPRLARALGIAGLWVKREDLTGVALGGNKIRELDLIVGEAVAQGCDVFVAGGGLPQSNHSRQCAGAARRAGLEPVIVLRRGRKEEATGNLLLTRWLAADIHWMEGPETASEAEVGTPERFPGDVVQIMEAAAAEYRKRGRRPYVLSSSFHWLSVAAYAECAAELADQLAAAQAAPDHIYVVSSGATQAGLVLGLNHLALSIPVTGVHYGMSHDGATAAQAALANVTAARLGLSTRLAADDFIAVDGGGLGYGITDPAVTDAIGMAARTEGLLVDPVYTAKGLAQLRRDVAAGRVRASDSVLFVHTGGVPALFAYPELAPTGAPSPVTSDTL